MQETALQSALRAWVVNASRLEERSVVWSEQPIVRLPKPFITLRLGDLIPLGSADEIQRETDLDKPAGQEITQTVIGRRILPVSIQCFGEGDSESPRQILSRVQTSLSLSTVAEALGEAGISVFDLGEVQNLSAVRETAFEPRALLEVRCYASEEVSESLTFIETVEITNQVVDPEEVFTVDLDL